MKYLALLAVVLAGCSSSNPYPKQELIVGTHASAMSRAEVINAIHDCQDNGMRAVLITAKKSVNNHITDVVSDVTCAPLKK